MAKRKARAERHLKILTELLMLLAIASCSEPQGWTLWRHSFWVEGDAHDPIGDEWRSFDTYLSLADCKKQIEPQLALAEKSNREELSVDYKPVQIEREKQGLTVTGTPVKTSKDAKTVIMSTRFFCLPLGQDPRPKDPLTWTLWRHDTHSDGDRVSYESWHPEESYLTGWRCMQEKHSRERSVQPYNEKSEKAAKGQTRWNQSFDCVPSTVNPWGKEG